MNTNRNFFQAGMLNSVIQVICLFFSLAVAVSHCGETFTDANWVSIDGILGTDLLPLNDNVLAAVVDDSGNLYIGGNFTVVGNVIANHIAKWDGSHWTALGSGVDGAVNALAVSGNNLYVGGAFTNAGGITASGVARWNGTNWSSLGSGVGKTYIGSPVVYALAVSGNDLYAGGAFTVAGGSPANYIAEWDGNSWTTLGSGLNTQVQTLAVASGNVYAGGDFTTAGGNPANCIAKWDGTNWSAVGLGLGGGSSVTPASVYALAISGNDLYVGGNFTTAGGIAATNIAKWDGGTWSPLGFGMGNGPSVFPTVSVLTASGGNVYAGGYFTTANDIAVNHIAKWDGSSWTSLGAGVRGGAPSTFANIMALAVSGGKLYAGGNFTTAGGSVAANNIAMWDGSDWTALGSGLGNSPAGEYPKMSALAVLGGDVYVGGNFASADGATVNYVAKWTGSNWAALGSGVNSNVYALTVMGTNLYVGGKFTMATNSGGAAVSANRIVKWDGSHWSALGSGMNYPVNALLASGTNLYAGGGFSSAGGHTAICIAKWNGSDWTNLAAGLNGTVTALAILNTNLYAGGLFTTAANTNYYNFSAGHIAKWNGSSWSAIGDLNGRVFSLATSGSNLYVGGSFTIATNVGGVTIGVTNIAKWDGNNWSAVDQGVRGGSDPYSPAVVYALAAFGGQILAGGNFTIAGNVAADYIAKWDGNTWSALGSGMSTGPYAYYVPPVVCAFAISGSDLYAGGGFTMAGKKVTGYFAHARLPLPQLLITRLGSDIQISWPSIDTASFTLEQAGSLGPSANWITDSAGISDNGTNKSIILSPANGTLFFRLRSP